MIKIHKTAVVDKKAKLDDGVEIGPYAIIGPHVTIKADTKIGSHCVIDGWTTLGKGNKLFTGAVIGSQTQDLKAKGEKSFVQIGDRNTFREYITVNSGTDKNTKTVIGNDNLFMAYSHIAHNCIVGNKIVIANLGTLAGHVVVEDSAIIGGMVAIHQFTKIGKMAIIGGCSKVVKDVVPFSIADGHPARIYGLNLVGLKRNGISDKTRSELKQAFRTLFASKSPISSALQNVESKDLKSKEVRHLVEFIKESERGIAR